MALLHEPAGPIHQAAKEGEVSILSKASKKQLNRSDNDGWTAVHWCAWSGDPGPLEIVLNRGGNPDKLDKKGCTPLHIAATYGNYQAIELLIEHKSDIFALEDRGFHASKVAALNRRLDCHRLLEMLYHQLTLTNPEYVKSQQMKAIKNLEKRILKTEKMEKELAKNSTSNGSSGKQTRFRLGSLKKERSVSHDTEENETFVLKDRNKNPDEEPGNEDKKDEDEEEETDGFDDMFEPIFKSQSAKNTLRPLPKMTSGAMLQTFEGVVGDSRKGSNSKRYDDTASTSSDPLQTSSHRSRIKNQRAKSERTSGNNLIGTMELINPTEYEIETDSSLVTFLHSVDAYDTGGVLLQEKMDMTSLMLCSEEDLKSIGIALGPRKRIMDGIEKRAAVLKEPTINGMIDTDL